MTVFLASLAFGAGVAAWVWSKVGRRTGHADQKTVFITAGMAGVGAFIVFFTLFNTLF